MRAVYSNLNSATFSPWVPVDSLQNAFGIGLGFSVSSGGVLTASVQHTFDDLSSQGARPVSVTQTTTVITATDLGYQTSLNGQNGLGGHNLSVGDWVQLTNTGIPSGDGAYSVTTVVSSTQYTLTSQVSQSATGGSSTTVLTARVNNHATLTGVSARASGNYAFPIRAARLLLTAWTSGVATLSVHQGFGR